MSIAITVLHSLTVVFAFIAAGFWFASAKVKIPADITRVDFPGLGLGEAVQRQAKRSQWAAICAALSALCQGLRFWLWELGW